MKYESWAMKVIEIICNDKGVDDRARLGEIKCVVRKDGHYPDSFSAGDSPEDAWQAALDGIASNQ